MQHAFKLFVLLLSVVVVVLVSLDALSAGGHLPALLEHHIQTTVQSVGTGQPGEQLPKCVGITQERPLQASSAGLGPPGADARLCSGFGEPQVHPPGPRSGAVRLAAWLAPGDPAIASPWEATGWRPSVRRPRR